jgi:hypothetical protein
VVRAVDVQSDGGMPLVELIAERLYRLTEEGIDRDSVMAGLPVAANEPLLNAPVLGQDTLPPASVSNKQSGERDNRDGRRFRYHNYTVFPDVCAARFSWGKVLRSRKGVRNRIHIRRCHLFRSLLKLACAAKLSGIARGIEPRAVLIQFFQVKITVCDFLHGQLDSPMMIPRF